MPEVMQTIERLKKEINLIEPIDAFREQQNNACIIVDIRDKIELLNGTITDSICIDRNFIEFELSKHLGNTDKNIILTCQTNNRSLLTASALLDCGYKNIFVMRGGYLAWKNANLPIFLPKSNLYQAKEDSGKIENNPRYSRQIKLKEIGIAGQVKLQKSKVLIVGAGGLGNPCLLYLCAAGIGEIGIIDHDIVELSNLHRQIIFNKSDIGLYKVDMAKTLLSKLNDEVNINIYREKLSHENAEKLIANYEIIIDGSDNFDCRYLINKICVKLSKINIHASVFGYEGIITTFSPNGPCYNCIYPAQMREETCNLSCSENGTLGVIPGIMGMLQATECIKIIAQIGENLIGKMLLYDAKINSFKLLQVNKNNTCKVCQQKS